MSKIKEVYNTIVVVLIVGAIIAVPISCEVYKYKDCRKVGHSKVYCIMRLSND